MRRAIFLAALLAALLWWAGTFQPRETGGLALEGGADAVGAVVYVNGHAVGRMEPGSRVAASPADTAADAKGPAAASSPASPRPDRISASRLDARAPLWRWNEIVVVSAGGARLSTHAVLSESTHVGVSFASRRLTVTPAGIRLVPAGADTSAEFDD